jgi:hypothetical protein
MTEHEFNTWHKSTTMWNTSWGLSQWDTHDNPITSKITYDDIKEAFLVKEWKLFPSLREETRLPPPQGFSQI